MLESRSFVTLSTGENVELAIIKCPDQTWAERVEKLLAHKDELARRAKGEKARAYVLENVTSAVVGFVLWSWHPLWPGTCLLDVYCHSSYWDKAKELLEALELPKTDRYMAYADATCTAKQKILQDAGFRETALLKNFVANNWLRSSFVDVTLLEK
jgi:hypothetical protein